MIKCNKTIIIIVIINYSLNNEVVFSFSVVFRFFSAIESNDKNLNAFEDFLFYD